MVHKVSFSPEANSRLIEISNYLTKKWSANPAKTFSQILEHKISILKSFPYSGPAFSDKKEIRKCIITKQITLYYRILDDEIEVATLFDSRQDIDKLHI